MSSFPLGTPVLDLVTVTQDPTATQNKDTSLVTATSGRHGETLVSEIHGARYVKASRGNLFWGTSGVAGASLLAPGGTTAGFVLYNPDTYITDLTEQTPNFTSFMIMIYRKSNYFIIPSCSFSFLTNHTNITLLFEH